MGTRQQEKDIVLVSSLETYRENNGLNISQLSEALGFTRPYVSRVLAEKKSPGIAFRHAASQLIEDGLAPKDTQRATKRPAESAPSIKDHLHHKIREIGERLIDVRHLAGWSNLVSILVKEEAFRMGWHDMLEDAYEKASTTSEKIAFHNHQVDMAMQVQRQINRTIEQAKAEIARLEAEEERGGKEKFDVDLMK